MVLFGWFGIPTITNGRPFIAEQLALRSPRMVHGNKIIGSFHRFTELTYLPVQLGALFALGVAWFRRNWPVLLVGASAILYVLTETALDLKGLPGQPRYIFEPAALEGCLAAVALGWLLIAVIKRSAALRMRVGAGVLAVALVGPMVPAAVARIRFERRDLTHERDRTKVINLLSGTINHLGGPKAILRCGHPVTNTEYASLLAWLEHVNVDNIGYLPKKELKRKYPILLFIELPERVGDPGLPRHGTGERRRLQARLPPPGSRPTTTRTASSSPGADGDPVAIGRAARGRRRRSSSARRTGRLPPA